MSSAPQSATRRPGRRARVIGTIFVLLVAAGCIRLGIWQLDRLDDRRTRNAAVAERSIEPPFAIAGMQTDSVGLIHRRAAATGRYDDARSIVLPGRSYRGSPGVLLLTPLRLDDGSAVLVQRGWVPSSDAATIDHSAYPTGDTITTVTGLLLPFPGAESSLAARATNDDSAFQRVWYNIEPERLRAQFPYPLLPFELQILGDEPTRFLDAGGDSARAARSERSRYPIAQPPPAFDEGPHLGYAVQWFSFAAIVLIGWIALLVRGGSKVRPPTAGVVIALAAAMLTPGPLDAQLRPIDPVEWPALDRDAHVAAGIGLGLLHDQAATLAGTRGRLLELGNWLLTIRSGRIALEFAGTAVRRFDDREIIESPASVSEAPDGQPRVDAGDVRVGTILHLFGRLDGSALAVRFGTRLPTPSDEPGLDRDRTDFFATAAGRTHVHPNVRLLGEAGVGIHGSLDAEMPQSDALIYAAGIEAVVARMRLAAHVVGHNDLHDWRVRGNEDLAELRVSAHVGRQRWLRATVVRGIASPSPSWGLLLLGGVRLW